MKNREERRLCSNILTNKSRKDKNKKNKKLRGKELNSKKKEKKKNTTKCFRKRKKKEKKQNMTNGRYDIRYFRTCSQFRLKGKQNKVLKKKKEGR